MNEDDACSVSLVQTPGGGFALAGIDDYLNEVGNTGDMGSAASRRKRRLTRKKKRYSKAGKAQRKAAIAARLAAKMAAAAGKAKRNRSGKAARVARRAARKGASVTAAVIAGLTAIGVSKKTAAVYAKRAIALLSGKKTKKKTKGTAVKDPIEKLIASAVGEENAAEASGETEEEEEGDGEEDYEDEGENGELDGEDAAFDEEYDSGPGGTEVGNYGALPIVDSIKPYIPWVVLGVGALAIWKMSNTPTTEAPKSAPKKKR